MGKTKKIKKLLFIFVLSVMLLVTLSNNKGGHTYSAGNRVVANVTIDGEVHFFSSLYYLSEKLGDYEGETIIIDMLSNWDGNSDEDYDNRLVIPKDSNVTFNMHGHIFDRGNVADEDVFTDGELIYVCPGASLTIIGITTDGERIQEHNNIPVYTDVEQDDAPGRINLKGAVLAGGNSKGGTGGIYIDSGKEVVIKEVAIAGCKASTGGFLVSYSGPGGGIIITESGTTLKMQNSRITGCLAEDDGGAIYGANDDNITIELDNSTIENNYANSDTGGINLDGSELTIRGKNKSKIKNNKGEGYGGGIYFWNDDTKITADKLGDLTIDGNSADEGGGIYINKENNEISNLVITNNNANKGGGIYIANDYTTINNCTITDNKTHKKINGGNTKQ